MFGVFGVFIVVAVEPVGFVFFGGESRRLGWWMIGRTIVGSNQGMDFGCRTSLSLTPTLSPREREKLGPVDGSNCIRGFGD